MTPTKQCYIKDGKTIRKDTTKNGLGHTLADYVDVQIDACNELDIPVYDAYHSTQFKPNIPSYRKSSMPDGVHPNEKGHEVIMYELIKNFYGFMAKEVKNLKLDNLITKLHSYFSQKFVSQLEDNFEQIKYWTNKSDDTFNEHLTTQKTHTLLIKSNTKLQKAKMLSYPITKIIKTNSLNILC